MKSTGYMIDGAADSIWNWYDAEGNIAKTGNYQKGLEHGIWITYHSANVVNDSGRYLEGRMTGYWITRHPNGNKSSEGDYARNYPVGNWKFYYENGVLSSEGNLTEDGQIGIWKNYYDNAQLSSETNYDSLKQIEIVNSWNREGKQLVTNGNGIHKETFANGNTSFEGMVENGKRTGKWEMYFEDGKKREEGTYENNEYLVQNSWSVDGAPLVVNGNGQYASYYDESGAVFETGEVANGLRTGEWKTYNQFKGKMISETVYRDGKLNGTQKYYYETGELYADGIITDNLHEGLWTWYHVNGVVQTSVIFEKDKKQGKQEIWDEAGTLVKEEIYEAGKLKEEHLM